MTAAARRPDGPDAVRVASLFGAVAGVLSLVDPYFNGLAVALAGLLLLAALRRRRGQASPPRLPWETHLPAVVVGIGWIFFLAGPAGLAPLRGLVLGLAGLPLGWPKRPAARAGGGPG